VKGKCIFKIKNWNSVNISKHQNIKTILSYNKYRHTGSVNIPYRYAGILTRPVKKTL